MQKGGIMSKIVIITLGILDILACLSLIVLHICIDWYSFNAFTWGLPLLIAALVALICGIFTLKTKNWKWSSLGLIVASVAWAYILFFFWLFKGYQ
jgi:hypothetical protein